MILIAAIATGISAWYHFYFKNIKLAIASGITNHFTNTPILSGVTFLLISIVVSPLMLLPVLIPSVQESFNKGIQTVILAEDPQE